MKQLFGTDGIRGPAGEFPLDESTVEIIGASFARQCEERLGRPGRLLTGRDTRESGEWIEAAFHAGARSAGAVCLSSGIITTPGVAFLTREFDMDAGVVVSASHNPYRDNGIKIFSPSGKKIDEITERKIEIDIHKGLSVGNRPASGVDSSRSEEFCNAYVGHLNVRSRLFARPLRLVIDCANGASSFLSRSAFKGLDAEVITINCSPDGKNINEGCGSLHLDKLRTEVIDSGADLGVAFDGDADRALFVDEKGNIVDGDATLWILANHLIDQGLLVNRKVVATVMSNIGLDLAFASIGVSLVRASVGDKYVLEQLLSTGAEIGGEQSGHIIIPRNSLVGDGMMTALLILETLREKGLSLSQAAAGFKAYPQVLVNVEVSEKLPFDGVPAIATAVREAEDSLNGSGRLLLRYSGTENLARVMIEGKDQIEIEGLAHNIAEIIRQALR
jgi:phosphoglucosamine mutase